MADEKAFANGNITVWVIPAAGIANHFAPTAAEINAGVNISPAIAWDGTTLPSATESDDTDDRSLVDVGNAVTRGTEQFEATLNMFRPRDVGDTVSDYGRAWQLLKSDRVTYYLVTRVLQAPNDPANTESVAAAGQFVSVFRMMSDAITDDTEGDDSVKYTTNFQPQGDIAVYTLVKTTAPVTVTPTTMALGVGDADQAEALLAGHNMTQGARWTSSNREIADVSQGGVVRGVAAGTATITVSHPSSNGTNGTIAVTVA